MNYVFYLFSYLHPNGLIYSLIYWTNVCWAPTISQALCWDLILTRIVRWCVWNSKALSKFNVQLTSTDYIIIEKNQMSISLLNVKIITSWLISGKWDERLSDVYIFQQSRPAQSSRNMWGNFLVVQWLELQTLTAEGPGSISGQGIKIWQAAKTEKKIYNNVRHIHNFEFANKHILKIEIKRLYQQIIYFI